LDAENNVVDRFPKCNEERRLKSIQDVREIGDLPL